MKLLHTLFLASALLQLPACAPLPAVANAPPALASAARPWTILPVAEPAAAVLTITPDVADRVLPLGRGARFRIAFKLDPYPADGVPAMLKLGPERLEGAERAVRVPREGLEVTVEPQTQAGFVRCTVSVTVHGKPLREWTTIGFAPDRIVATQSEPADFDAYWAAQKAALDRVPLNLQVSPAPELSSPSVQVSHISFQNVGNWSGHSRFYGVLAVPTGAGPFPALLSVPGAGVRPDAGNIAMAERGFITLQVGIHGIPVNLPKVIYDNLASGALKDHPLYQLDDRNAYYYRRVYLGVWRASEVLAAQSKWDGRNLLVAGGSQGGQLSIVAAALNTRISGLAANHPAYSDVSGYLHGRAGGWPGLFRPGADGQPGDAPVAPKLLTTGYDDTVNFARRLKVPEHYAWGFNDTVTPPTSLHAVYNTITAPKTLVLAPEQGHSASGEQNTRVNAWLLQQAGLAPVISTKNLP